MPDFGSPVAVNVNVNPNQGIQTLSGLLGLKQQQQALQTGQALQESAKAEAVTKGIEAQGQTEGANYFRNMDFGKWTDAGGMTDVAGIMSSDPAYKKLGAGKEPVTNALLAIRNNQIKNKQDLSTLNTNVLAGAAQIVSALPDKKDLTAEDANASIDLIDSMYGPQGSLITEQLRKAVNSPHQKPEDLAAKIRAWSLQAHDVVLSKLGTTYDAQGNLTGFTQRPTTGEVTQAPGAGMQQGLGPTQTPGYQAAVSGAQAAATGEVSSDVGTYNAIRTSGQNATAVRGLAQQVAAMAKDVDTGVLTGIGAKTWAGLAQRLGYKPTDVNDPGVKRAILGKMAAQLESQAEASAPSDSVREGIKKAFPDPDNMPAGAVIDAARYVDGVAAVNQQRLKNAEAYKKTHKGNVTGLSTSDSAFVLHADPAAAHYAELDPASQRRYLEEKFKDKNGKIDKQAVIRFIQNVNALKHANAANSQVLGGQQ